jgi:hypothetical protein
MRQWVKTENPLRTTLLRKREHHMESGGKHRRRRTRKGGTGTVYRIVVREELSERFASAFEGMEMETKAGQTILTGEVIDQPHLHGILGRINGLGLKLVSVESVPQEPNDDAASYPPTADQAAWKALES